MQKNRVLRQVALAVWVAVISPNVYGQEADKDTLEHREKIYGDYTPENFDDGGPISHYVWKNFPAFFPHDTIARTTPERTLTSAIRPDIAAFTIKHSDTEKPLDTYVQTSPLIDGMIILADGKIVYETYPRMQSHQRHITWSVSKVFISTALAALEHQGKIDMDAAVETYVPELKRTDWADISVRNIINMASGMACLDSDGYQDTNTCIYRYEESLGLTAPTNEPMSSLDVIRSIRRYRTANTKYEYASPNTYVASLVIENITQQPLAIALQNLLWANIGAEADGMMMISPKGKAAAHGGISARLRDIARFGQIFTNPANAIVGMNHLTDLRSTNGIAFSPEQVFRLNKIFTDDVPSHAAWQWDMIWPDGAMFKGGYSGQGLFIDPDKGVVIAFFGTASLEGKSNELLPIARQLTQAGLFDK
jgi:CubicO group peptidase (beta-lactamase class C family)